MATKENITDALAKLDHTNDNHWTDDGQPRTSVIRELAKDPNITRKEIVTASPGFLRKPPAPPADADGAALIPETGAVAAKPDETSAEAGGVPLETSLEA